MAHHEDKGHSEACCNIPPVTHEYTVKGEYKELNGLKTYVTGPESAELGIVFVYDIMGFSPQGNQGADILATADDKKKYLVFIPDFLKGEYADKSWFPMDTDEKKQKLGALFGGIANPQTSYPTVISYTEKLKEQYPNIKKWGIIGFCWGGKVITLTLNHSSLFTVAASCHPGMVDAKDAEKVNVPFLMLPSKDEDPKAVEEFGKALKVEHKIETFKDQIHGWMGARGDLKDERVNSEFKRGYETVLHFFHKHI